MLKPKSMRIKITTIEELFNVVNAYDNSEFMRQLTFAIDERIMGEVHDPLEYLGKSVDHMVWDCDTQSLEVVYKRNEEAIDKWGILWRQQRYKLDNPSVKDQIEHLNEFVVCDEYDVLLVFDSYGAAKDHMEKNGINGKCVQLPLY